MDRRQSSSERNLYEVVSDDSSHDQTYRRGNGVGPNRKDNIAKSWVGGEDFAKSRPTKNTVGDSNVAEDVPSSFEKRAYIPGIKEMLDLQEKFSDSLSSIMSTINCAAVRKSDASLLRDEDFYWPTGEDLYDDDDEARFYRPSIGEHRKHFSLSNSSLVPLKPVEG